MAVSRKARVAAVIALAAAAAPVFLSNPAQAAPDVRRGAAVVDARRLPAAGQVVIRAAQITSFTQIRGQAAWKPSAMSRVANATWVFSGDGTFTFTTIDVRSDLYPLRGRWQLTGRTMVFSAHASSAIGGSSAFTEMIGGIDFTGAQPVMRLAWASGAGYGAVVNNQQFGTTASASYQAVVIVRGG